MKTKLTKLIAAITLVISGIFIMSAAPTTYALDVCADENSPIYEASGCGNQAKAESVVGNIIKAVIGILGLAAVIFIVIGGVQYMTSTGEPAKTKKAKDTILYAVIGLVIAALAFAITNFAISAING